MVDSMRAPLPQRRTVRLATSNYFSASFLTTIATSERSETFGLVEHGEVHLSALGAIVEHEIEMLETRRTGLELDAYIVMPNHVHIVVSLSHGREITEYVEGSLEDNSLGSVIGGLKSGVTRRARQTGLIETNDRVWQRGFHESMLRTERAILDACTYVERSPMWWKWDPLRDA